MSHAMYRLTAPDVKTGNIVVTYGSTANNILVHIFEFQNVNQSSPVASNNSESYTTPASKFEVTFSSLADYSTRLVWTRATTGTHAPGFGQEEALVSGSDAVTTNSASYSGLSAMSFVPSTDFSIKTPERITTLTPFDIDVLVGTKIDNVNKCRVLRWDTVSSGWSAEDDIQENGINAFIRDDNFVYAQAGDYGRLYFYNGEKLEPYKRLPGEWSPTKRARVHAGSVAFHLGIPVFGVSNVEGNPILQGVYGFGSYSVGYSKSLSLDFPLPSMAGVTVGSVVSRGADLYVAYKTATDVGVAKLNWSAKYTGAYIETRVLTHPSNRSDLKHAGRYYVDYVALPTSTNVAIGVKTKHQSTYTDLVTVHDVKRMQVRADKSTPEVASLQIKVAFTVNNNDGPTVENIAYE